ncbi:MAG: hypothetical protein KAH77_03780 [Thiomargarita sp.]|nr:hypothetical protein [Thiomargarita sp.]
MSQANPSKPRGCLLQFFWMFVIIILVFVGLTFGRQWYDSLLVHLDHNKAVHTDKSLVKTGIHSQINPTVSLIYTQKNGKKVRVIADAAAYSKFVNQQVRFLENSRTQVHEKTKTQLQFSLVTTFDTMQKRVNRFADWYFAYPTTYKILWEATLSSTRHAFSTEATSLSDSVSYDVEKYLHMHYKNIVLRPEISDSKLQTAYKSSLTAAHDHYLDILSHMQSNFQVFVSQYTTHLKIPSNEKTVLKLDWESQFKKFNMADYEKGPKGALVGTSLAASGAVLGKGIAGAAAKGAVSKGIFAKFSAPFVSKAVLAASSGAIGTLGGPIGTVLGVVGGLSIDYAINAGVELTQRDRFITDIQEALRTTQNDWEQQMQNTLHDAINIWMDDTIQLLPRYEQR